MLAPTAGYVSDPISHHVRFLVRGNMRVLQASVLILWATSMGRNFLVACVIRLAYTTFGR